MYDNQATPVLRLKMGYDAGEDDFVFEMYDESGKKGVYLDADGTEVLDGKFLLTYLGNTLLEAYKDTNGGKIAIYDNSGNLNVKMGVEGTGGTNVGGTLVLYNDSAAEQRVALGINGTYDSGIMILYDDNNQGRVYATAQQSGQASIFLYDSDGNLKSRLSENTGTINGETIATENFVTGKGYATESFVTSQGYITGTTGFSGSKVIGAETYTWTNGVLVSVV
jgi:hypothetical protein